jgi:hypothetical protein
MTEADEAVLKAEVVALQAVLMSVFRRIVTDRPDFAPLFCQAFDEAETILSGVAVKLGMDAPVESTIGALRIIEELRSAVIRDPEICRERSVPLSPAHHPGPAIPRAT